MLRERDGDGDRAKAICLLDGSLAISSELGMRPLMERALARKLELQGVASLDIQTSIDAVASAVAIERPDLRPHTAPDGTVTILFSDIEGSTQMTERLGDQRMQQVLRGHNDIVRQQVAAHGGFEVKSWGTASCWLSPAPAAPYSAPWPFSGPLPPITRSNSTNPS